MIFAEALGLAAVGALAGVVSTVVSLASVVSYPALLAFGLSPLSANVTNTVALLFTGLGAAAGSRPELAGQGRRVLRLGWVTALGGATGALLLLLTPSQLFEVIAPWLIAAASLLLIRPPRLGVLAGDLEAERGWPVRAALFAVAIYIGYFGAAGGVLMFAVLTAVLDQSPVRVNAVKNVVSALANGVAAVGFAIFGPVQWSAALPLAAGFLVGGWLGPAIARRLPGQSLRVVAAVCGLLVALKLGIDAYR
ncbi:sulfite exporter TauE/SafE family protein [Streptosporangium sp. NBC_01639]|uniref:sulfite exporter TauE/SafE family protein n=1 Tax=Streptosporangium sp. NBC_01639 TaxID=2975948 RepID=UPI00386ADD16|nr:sulfite exporter TauE/SafE family protein [Streptosporangium sp. NBC_01639]